mmetsp:Transcript_24481/g.52752  ORF Transcript_24481/g.52752 Transcript_24481/m.52752 type:complete len:298 (-) Transcript_24481:216-1109(-)|eukprot:CAMPEP_0172308598 /NCGR_PEP_ID=MMETSP1058-20130122/9141_1 /TAXON_ID=83371 /ORGANISM="Detonula confervacea, Strain CCMP 353" /LENGTH=297 /DNA_ID=CAMNT_0013021047 /DNA_START=86 /DNA_END=979 /DNA_ORIENTATION=+
MNLSVATLALLFAAAEAFQTGPVGRAPTSLNVAAEKLEEIFASKPAENPAFDKLVRSNFPGAISNKELATRVVELLEEKGFTSDNTLLATSVCADELARELEDQFVDIYGNNFNLGGLSGFPFAGNTGWGAMSAHVPDGGYCLTIHGPHVGITKDGVIGKVERSGIALVDNCCGSAIAASNYLKGITDGSADINPRIQQFSDFQQGAVQELILPFGKRLDRADDRMRELPYALYDSQEVMVTDIVTTGKASIKSGLAVLGGIQINTGPDTLDYFHPLRFDYFNEDGDLVENLLPYLR